MKVETVAIGNELLLGEILDSNTQFIARALRDGGFELTRATVVGDHPDRIVAALREAAGRADAVITCGGLGPTVDDPTREAAAAAAGVGLVFHPELWDAIQARFQRIGRFITDNNKKQAQLPASATALPNPFGTAPGFSMPLGRSILFAVPGVPSEMEAMIAGQVVPELTRRAGSPEILRQRTLHVAGPGESQIDEQVGRWESGDNPTVGLMAHAGTTDIRIVGRGESEQDALRKIAEAEDDIRARLTEHIYGADSDTLAGAVLRLLPENASLVTAEFGTGGSLAGLIAAEDSAKYLGGLVFGRTPPGDPDGSASLRARASELRATHAAGLTLSPVDGGYRSEYLLLAAGNERRGIRTHQVPYAMASRWAASVALTAFWNLLRNPKAE